MSRALPLPPNASGAYWVADFVDNDLVALGPAGRVVIEPRDLRIAHVDAVELPTGPRRVTARGCVVGQSRENGGRGRLTFFEGAQVVYQLEGARPETATWLGESIEVDGTTVVARCRANRYNEGSQDWLVVLRHDGTSWNLEAELPANWLYAFDVSGDMLVFVDAGGIHTCRRDGTVWTEVDRRPFASGSARVALEGHRMVLARSTQLFVTDWDGSWSPATSFQLGREGTYPNYHLSLSGDRLAIGGAQGGVRLFRRYADGEWREELRLRDKKTVYTVALHEDFLVYTGSEGMVCRSVSMELQAACLAVAPKGAAEAFEVLWTSPEEKKRRHFLARLPDGQLGLATKVGRSWKWNEGDWSTLSEIAPEAWRADLERAAES